MKRFFLPLLLVVGFTISANAQRSSLNQLQNRQGGNAQSTAASPLKPKAVRRDTVTSVIPDSLRSTGNKLETTVDYSARDSTILDVASETVYLYGDAVVNYGDIELKASFIKLSWGVGEVYAYGLPDSSKTVGEPVSGKPVFSQGNESYNTDTIRYNFNSKRAIIKNIVTQQGDGFVRGEKVKKDSSDNLYLTDAMYTTCNLTEPHFHIAAKKIKLVDKKNVISGPFRLMIANIPTPLLVPFGFFPVPKDKEIGTSGFIMGQYGEEPRNRGFFFRDFGWYQAINKNIGIKVLGQIYSRGSWGAGVQSTYTQRYRYGGNVNLQFNKNKPGDVVLAAQRDSDGNPVNNTNDFNISWSHAPQSRRSDRSFSASVNLQSNSFAQNNQDPNAVQLFTANTSNSSVQYTRNIGSKLRTSVGVQVNQNFSTKVFNFNSSYNIGLNQFNPFIKEENQTGRWIEQFRVGLDIQGGFQATNDITGRTRSTTFTEYQVYGVSNEPLTEEELRLQALGQQDNVTVLSLLDDFDRIVSENGQFRTTYTVPISLPNFKLAKFINITPSVNYRGEIFTQRLNYEFFERDTTFTRDGEPVVLTGIDENFGAVRIDTTNGFYNTYNVSAGISMNTRIYGTYQFKGKGRLQAIRHTIAPSVSMNYTPDLKDNTSLFTKTRVRSDDPEERYLSRFPALGSVPGASGLVSFSLTNQLEAKLRSKSDTAESQTEKISLLDNFGISGGYNLLQAITTRDSVSTNIFNLSNINFNANTQILKDLVSLNFNATLDPYAYTEDAGSTFNLAGRRINTFKWQNAGFDGSYFSQMQISVSTRLSPETFNKDKRKKEPVSSIGGE
ncbi:MAG: putative LPS assembly protein LptD, partial [Spirosomaceae bacterium]|nr:putative LPS assembly protein LptD [Spirosomataceae bacterium]